VRGCRSRHRLVRRYYDPPTPAACTHFVGVTPGIVEHMVGPECRAPEPYCDLPTIESGPAVDRPGLATAPDAPCSHPVAPAEKGLESSSPPLAELPGCIAWIAGDGPWSN